MDFFLFREYLLSPELGLDSSLDLETISEEYISFLCEDREDELVIIFESMWEVIECHDCVFHFFSIERLLEEVVELDLVELTDDEYIYDIVRIFVAKIEYRIRYRHEIESFASFEELLHGLHHIIGLDEHLNQIWIDRTSMIHLVVFLFVLLVRLEDSKSLEIHQLSTYRIDLLIDITTELTDKKSSIRTGYHIFDNEFFEEFDSRTRAEEFD